MLTTGGLGVGNKGVAFLGVLPGVAVGLLPCLGVHGGTMLAGGLGVGSNGVFVVDFLEAMSVLEVAEGLLPRLEVILATEVVGNNGVAFPGGK